MLRASFLLLGPFLALLAAPTFAQTTWHVSGAGNDATGDGTSGNPYRTITQAMSVASSGDEIEVGDGTYDAAAGEVFPITIPNDFDLHDAPGSGPVIDGDGAGTLFEISASITLETRITGLAMQNCATAVHLVSGASISGQLLIIEECAFNGFTTAAFRADFTIGGGNQFVLQDCNLDGNNAAHGVRVELSNGADLILGQIEDCNIVDCSVGVAVLTTDNATVDPNFKVRRNDVSDYDVAGVHVQAQGVDGAATTNDVTVDGNILLGSGSVDEVGILLEALHDQTNGGSTAILDGDVIYNEIRQNDVNILVRTRSNGADAQSDLTCDFLGNHVLLASDFGVQFDAESPVAAQDNLDPDFGSAFLNPNGSGRNTFEGSGTFEWSLDGEMQNQISAENNFWDEAIPSADMDLNGALIPDTDPLLDEPLNPIPKPSNIPENEATNVDLDAGDATTMFVGNPDADAITNTITVTVGGVEVDALPSADGTSVTINVPPMASGNKTVVVTNAAGQEGSTVLGVGGGGGGGSGGDGDGGGGGICVVATAAYGDYDAREVRVLRAFRDDYLLAEAPGRAATAAYYEHGPSLAEAIAGHDWARGATRAALQPVVLLAAALLEWGAAARLAAGVGLLGLLFWLRRRR